MDGLSRACATFALNAAWQVAVIVAAAALGGWLMRKAPARYQHALWLLALLLSVALPLATVLPLDAAADMVVTSPVVSASGLTEAMPLLPPPEAQSGWTFSRLRWTLPLASGLGWWLVAAIGMAFLVRTAALVRALRAAEARRRTARAEVPERLSALGRISEQALGLRNVPVLSVPGLAGPVTLGVRQPVILWPEGFWEGQPDDVLLAALGHEMAHIRRRDYGLNLLYELALLPLAWHPAARILRQKIDQTREMACDEMVAEKLLDGPRYARSLVAIAATARAPASSPPRCGTWRWSSPLPSAGPACRRPSGNCSLT
jgi:beta-lactamase regulating signal transducer with metallopeptidase domain